ncbi:hypothetical protein SCLCIDRAFT_14846 [Scleroderma citrinum Foug A]|uniref:DUF4218 domain-containing protein n=1 Tax=Scleroderma citrinum Foug A TaxID=1036808 RepID=A0A0C3EBC4_9AGAM|nr:hypothetical protein SCLCIDRAFT_14846 [Scleroderma citrinum Foug A]
MKSVDAPGENEWFPWPNKLSCTIDILMHLPRSVFSQRQVDLLTWILHINGVQNVPSVRTLKTLEDGLQKICGIETLPFTGALGHKYYMNSLADIIRQEMANPHVRSQLHFYPEDTGKQLNEAFQARRWLKEMDPTQWFCREKLFFAKAWPLRAVVNDTGSGWIVEGHTEIEISQKDLLVSFKNWRIRIEKTCQTGVSLEPWTLTNPHEGNRWRVLANGARVYSFPIWLYCDDTSGNLSKCWNKHNSFLFTPAGLPRVAVHQEYNIHFLCTSNTAPPLEMLDGFVNQLENAQETGIWAWDCIHKEKVLVIPAVLALLGDNPMQSELACHVGLMGKYFCRVCNVKGHDAHDTAPTNAEDDQIYGTNDGGQSEDQESVRSEGGESAHAQKKSRGKGKKETMNEMVSRIKRFVKIGEPREREHSITELKSMFTMASIVGNQTKVKDKKTSSGLKDAYLEYYLDGMAASYKKRRGGNSKQQGLDEFIQELPENIYSPVWHIKGLNPHSDTPVEVLHTVLLGFVKYFWRDAVHIRIGKNKIKRELLETRLSSFDTSGLGIPPLSGHTLVQYAGSLVGRDFRTIAQAAPFVLHGLVPQECYDAWIALSKIVPLIWKPEIEDLDAHLTLLESAIQNFLAHTAYWTPRWFNKPKFHILLHLPEHIRCFGPAALFATEGFESFNAVIRAKSIYSNRQSPSHDIARAFAHGNRIRHILSDKEADREATSKCFRCW